MENPSLCNLHRNVSYTTVSKALEKFSIIAMVTSPLFIALGISSLIASKGTLEEPLRTSAWEASAPVNVWQLFLNPEGVGLRPTLTV